MWWIIYDFEKQFLVYIYKPWRGSAGELQEAASNAVFVKDLLAFRITMAAFADSNRLPLLAISASKSWAAAVILYWSSSVARNWTPAAAAPAPPPPPPPPPPHPLLLKNAGSVQQLPAPASWSVVLIHWPGVPSGTRPQDNSLSDVDLSSTLIPPSLLLLLTPKCGTAKRSDIEDWSCWSSAGSCSRLLDQTQRCLSTQKLSADQNERH